MKKSILGFLCLAAASAVFAGAQVYEMTITLKTTVSASGKVTPVVCDTPMQEVNLYRKTATVKIKGVFWGCDCETIAEPSMVSSPEATYGYIFWNETSHKVLESSFDWKILNRIEKKLKKAEGAWTLGDADEGFYLTGAGFGTVKDTVSKADCYLESVILTPMSGACAGWLSPSEIVVSKGTAEICEKCSVVEGTDDVVAIAPGWSLCACDEGSEFAAASGSWKLKFNAAAAAKWAKADASLSITRVYSFPSYVKSYIESLGE